MRRWSGVILGMLLVSGLGIVGCMGGVRATREIASVGQDRKVRLWQSDGKPLITLPSESWQGCSQLFSEPTHFKNAKLRIW
jgi:hypothetical protein